MLDVVLFHLAKLPLLPLTLLLALRDVASAPRGVSLTMRLVLLNLRLRFHKNLRSLALAQAAVNKMNAAGSAEYCSSFPAPPKGVLAREIQLHAQEWSPTLAHSSHGWKFFLIEPAAGRHFPSKRPFLLYSHGGSFVNTFHTLHFKFMYDLVQRTGAAILAHDYPRPPAGATHEETYAVLVELVASLLKPSAELKAQVSHAGGDEAHLLALAHDRTKLVFAGDSAGGSISIGLTWELLQRDLDHLLPDELILVSPGLDGRLVDAEKHDADDPWLAIPPCHTVIRAWAGPHTALTHYLVSPALAPEPLLRAFLTRATKTRLTTFQGTADILLPGAILLHERLEGAAKAEGPAGVQALRDRVRLVKGVGMPHVWPLIPIPAPEVREARDAIVNLINSDH